MTLSVWQSRAHSELRRREQHVQRLTLVPRSSVVWAEREATIVHPRLGRVGFTPYPYQRDFLSCTAPRRFILKARQIGFSQVFALEALYTAITQPESMILMVSRSQDLAINLLRYCYQAYNGLRNPPTLDKENESEMGFANGSRIKSLPANRSTGRGFAATAVYLDEFAYASYAEDIYQSVGPAVSQGGRLTVGSTPNGAGNLFHNLYTSDSSFVRFVVPWHHCPAYYTPEERAAGLLPEQAAWYQEERPKYTSQQWAAEYDCDFVGSGLGLFDTADIDAAAHGAPAESGPLGGRRYVTTVDVGRRRDATVINTFDVGRLPYVRVAFDRLERVPFPYIQQRIAARALLYPGELWVESNGIGDPVIENLDGVQANAFVTTARSKLQALQALQLLFERREIKARWDDREKQALIGCSWDEDHTPDEVMSLAIFAHVIQQGAGGWDAASLGKLSTGRKV